MGTYGESFKQTHGNALLKLEVKRTTSGSNNTHSFTLTGLASGTIDKIGTTALHAAKLTLTNNSAFVGKLEELGNGSSVSEVEMHQGSKLLLENEATTLKTLTLSNVSFDSTKLSVDALSQSTNTIIDLASVDRTNTHHFRLLTLGNSTGNAQDSGLQGSNALFRIYLDTSVDANGASNKLGGSEEGANGTSGYAYSDRILIESGSSGTHQSLSVCRRFFFQRKY